ncbi:MAG: sugar phosphate isomerase/epimerase [Parafilimonas sp.]
MQTSRRTFIRNSSFAIAGTALFSSKLFSLKSKEVILGIQLYSVRDDMQKNPVDTLKQLAAMGYSYAEHANYKDRKFYGYTAGEFKKILYDLGLKMPSGHTVLETEHWDSSKNDFTDAWKYTIEDAATVGQQYVISPSLDDKLRKNYDDLLAYMEVLNKCGELCKKQNMKFGYHNHDFEFNTIINGKKLYDIILQNTDHELVAQQIDIGNMYGAGGRAAEIINQYPGRFELMHVKDEIKSEKGELGGYESTILGTGVVGVKDIIDLAKKIGGTLYFIVEQESYQGKTPLKCAKTNFNIMKNWGY